MIYPENFEEKIRFNKIKDLIKEECVSNLGRERVDAIQFISHKEKIEKLVSQTYELKQLMVEDASFNLAHFTDGRDPLNRIRIEGLFMEEAELFELKRSLQLSKEITRTIQSKEEPNYPQLKELSAKVTIYPYVIDRIDRILNKYGKIKDNATPELARIKEEIRKTQGSISKRMTFILNQAKKEGLVEAETTIAVRDGKSVIPILSAHKRRLQGIVHDESATGKTAYIEPTEIVEMNNALKELEYAERREITKILIETANDLRPYINELLFNFQFLGIIDFIRAKARFSEAIKATKPIIGNDTESIWENAFHPLLYLKLKKLNEEIVPLSIEFNNNQRIILISGPNAGGKSVCLQTVGLVQYMFQCGLLVPMREGSRMTIYNDLFMDMGDEQSIENDLSTYSSHLLNMRYFLKNASEKTLILIDEFGTGTEPMMGGAIAESVLQTLNQAKVYGLITTHYTNLKHFAAGTEGITNGAMLFDTQRIQPLFKLQIGQPGSSFAFEIARKIGLSEEVLTLAKEKLGQDHFNFDKNLREINRDKRYWEEKRENIKKQDKQLHSLIDQYTKDLSALKAERKEILEKARNEAKALISDANKTIENAVRSIREAQAEKERTKEARESIKKVKEQIENPNQAEDDKIAAKMAKIIERQNKTKEKTNQPEVSKAEAKVDERPLAVGDRVYFEEQNMAGTILTLGNGEATVAFGNISTKLSLNRVQRISKSEEKKLIKHTTPTYTNSATYDRIRERKLNFKPDIDLRGVRGDDAMDLLTNFIDDAIMCGAPSVRILHGKGNGILRDLVRNYLKTIKEIASFGDEHVQFGGSGITIATFR